MKLTVLTKSTKPIYEQIFEQISGDILNGNLQSDECLPSIRFIAKELGIGIITVKKAYELLENGGFIYTLAGKGCFVKPLSGERLAQKKLRLAEAKLREELPYYRSLGLNEEELVSLIKKLYDFD